MLTKSTLAFAIATLPFAPLVASADEAAAPVAPVAFTACAANAGSNGQAGGLLEIAAPIHEGARYNVSFTNHGNVPATSVVFDVNNAGHTQRFTEDGTFAVGTVIDKDLAGRNDFDYSGGQATCSVVRVAFSDGTSWSLPDAVAKSEARTTAAK